MHPLRQFPARTAAIAAGVTAATALAFATAAEAVSPVVTAAMRKGFWRKGCMTFTLLEARHGGAVRAHSARDD